MGMGWSSQQTFVLANKGLGVLANKGLGVLACKGLGMLACFTAGLMHLVDKRRGE